MIAASEIQASLEPVTPVHVWSGSQALLGLDAIVNEEKNTLDVLDLEASLAGLDREALDKLVQLVERRRFRDAVKLIEKPVYALRADLKVWRDELKRREGELVEIRLLHPNIVPGSSLKGYVRTAVIYHMLASKDPGHARKILDHVDLTGDPIDVGFSVEKELLKIERPGRLGGFIDLLAGLSISDPEVRNSSYALRKIQVVHISNLRPIAPLYAITFERGLLEYKIQILSPSQHVPPEFKEIGERFSSFVNMLRGDGLIKILRGFGCDLVEDERRKISGISGRSLNPYRETLDRLWQELCAGDSKSGCAPARIGFATSHEAKTVAVYLKKHHGELYRNIKGYMSGKVGRTWDSLTLKITETTQGGGGFVGLGWCRICFQPPRI